MRDENVIKIYQNVVKYENISSVSVPMIRRYWLVSKIIAWNWMKKELNKFHKNGSFAM